MTSQLKVAPKEAFSYLTDSRSLHRRVLFDHLGFGFDSNQSTLRDIVTGKVPESWEASWVVESNNIQSSSCRLRRNLRSEYLEVWSRGFFSMRFSMVRQWSSLSLVLKLVIGLSTIWNNNGFINQLRSLSRLQVTNLGQQWNQPYISFSSFTTKPSTVQQLTTDILLNSNATTNPLGDSRAASGLSGSAGIIIRK